MIPSTRGLLSAPADYHGSREKFLPAGPFLAWVEEYKRKYGEPKGVAGQMKPGYLSITDLCEVAGTNVKRLNEAKRSGKIAEWIMDNILIAAGAPVMLLDLYPEEYLPD